jgi:uncharacterized protein YlxP (DUF503 family)
MLRSLISPAINNAKKKARMILEKPTKKTKVRHNTYYSRTHSKDIWDRFFFASSRQVGITIGQVMEHVAACGARYDTNEHFVATELFVKKDQREMFSQSRSAPAAYARSQVARLSDCACGLAEPASGPPLPIPHRSSKINPPPLNARLPSPAAYSRAAT